MMRDAIAEVMTAGECYGVIHREPGSWVFLLMARFFGGMPRNSEQVRMGRLSEVARWPVQLGITFCAV